MLVLTIVGVTGIIVYSYKMSRSRVYPVGIVRRPLVAPSKAYSGVLIEHKPGDVPEFSNSSFVEDTFIWNNFSNEELSAGSAQLSQSQTAKLFYVAQHHSHDHLMSVTGSLPSWGKCPHCGVIQKYEKEMRCARCGQVPDFDRSGTGDLGLEATKATALQSQLSQQGQALRDLDNRIRQLEKDSVVKKIAEVAGEKEGRRDWVQ